MLTIKNLKISNYRLFGDTEVNFENRKGIYSIVGVNNDASFTDSNGSGKSTLALALEQSLTNTNHLGLNQSEICPIHSDAKPRLEIDIKLNEDELTIIHDYHSNSISIYENGYEVLYKAPKPVKSKWIEDRLGLRPSILFSLFYLNVESNLFFLEKDPKAQYRLLLDLLSLNFLEDYEKKAIQETSILNNKYGAVEENIKLLQETIKNLEEQINSMTSSVTQNVGSKLEALKQEREDLLLEKTPLDKHLSKLREKETTLNGKKIEVLGNIKAIQRDIKKYEGLDDKCPTCGSDVDKEHIEKELASLSNQLIIENEAISELNAEGITLKQEIIKLNKEMEDIISKSIKLDYDIRKLEDIEKEAFKDKAKAKLKDDLRAKRDTYLEQLTLKQLDLDQIEKELATVSLIKQCAGKKGYVNDRVKLFVKLYNQYLADLSASLLNKELDLKIVENDKREFSLLVNDYESSRSLSYAELSAGTQSRVKLIALFALLEVIETLSGITTNVLIIDELLSSIDKTGINKVKEMFPILESKFSNKCILFVTHNQDLNTKGTLLVERIDNRSTLRWQE
jgi:DNA repair exonuclease SbcCD ATPase subunit